VATQSFALDHAVIFVEDLSRAAEDYATLGFRVVPGGVHAGGITHNALITFDDGTYLELLAPTRRWRITVFRALGTGRLAKRVTRGSPLLVRDARRVRAGEGLIDFALAGAAVAGTAAVLREAGGADGPVDGGRERPDGQRIAWRLVFPRAGVLPFLIEDTTPRHLRVAPAGPHPNGVTGIQAVTVVTATFDRTVAQYQTLLGREPFETVAPIPRSLAVEFRLDATVIRLVAPTGTQHPLRAYLDRWGPGVYNLVLRADKAANLDPGRAHGAQITLAKS